MNIKKVITTTHLNTSFFAGFLVSTFLFLLVTIIPGISKEKPKVNLNESTYEGSRPQANYPNIDGKNVEGSVQFLSNGEIRVFDEKNNVKLINNNFMPKGSLLNYHTITFLTLEGDLSKDNIKEYSLSGIMDYLIKPVNAKGSSDGHRHETHIEIIDGTPSCIVHRYKNGPNGYHVFDHEC